MDLVMAIRMEQNPVFHQVAAAQSALDEVMVVPARQGGNLLVADWTQAVLLVPQVKQSPLALQGRRHLDAEAFFEVQLPGRIVGIGFAFDLCRSLDGHTGGGEQPNPFAGAVPGGDSTLEDPVTVADGNKVFILDPAA